MEFCETMTANVAHSPEALRAFYAEFRQNNKRAFRRDAADAAGVSEAELLAAECGEAVVRLQTPSPDMLHAFGGLGRVMMLTRNEACVSEQYGVYENIRVTPHAVVVLNPGAADLRLFLNKWALAFAATEPGPHGEVRRSIQIFDAAGDSTHKIYVKDDEFVPAFDAFVARFRAEDQAQTQAVAARAALPVARPDSEIDVKGLLEAWGALQDTHDFYILLQRFGVTRTQALRLAQGKFTERLAVHAYRPLLEAVRDREIPIMVFIGNPGSIQIYTGPIRKLVDFPGWFNIMDKTFTMHLLEKLVVEAWFVDKPTKDGGVHSLELFDAEGREIVIFFGERKPGIPERADWREALDSLRAIPQQALETPGN